MNILGLSAFYHDSAACLVRDGELVAAAQEERFTRKKSNAAQYCLAQGGIGIGEVDHVVFYDKPLIKFERLLETYFATAPRGLRSFLEAMPLWMRQKLWMTEVIWKELGWRQGAVRRAPREPRGRAFFPSPFDEAAVLTVDGVGEWATTTLGVGRSRTIELLGEMRFRARSACSTPRSPTSPASR